MQLGMIGLGRMGANMVKRLLLSGHEVVAYANDFEIDDLSVFRIENLICGFSESLVEKDFGQWPGLRGIHCIAPRATYTVAGESSFCCF